MTQFPENPNRGKFLRIEDYPRGYRKRQLALIEQTDDIALKARYLVGLGYYYYAANLFRKAMKTFDLALEAVKASNNDWLEAHIIVAMIYIKRELTIISIAKHLTKKGGLSESITGGIDCMANILEENQASLSVDDLILAAYNLARFVFTSSGVTLFSDVVMQQALEKIANLLNHLLRKIETMINAGEEVSNELIGLRLEETYTIIRLTNNIYDVQNQFDDLSRPQ